MKKLKIFSLMLALCLVLPAILILTACGNADPGLTSNRTMSLSINPELSFVVDKDNKVVSVSYEGNDDAGTIYANIDFENMDVSEAIKVFVENATLSGHIGLANGTANNVTIEVNGSVEADIANLEALAKSEVEKTFDSLGIDIEVVISELTESELKTDLVDKAKELYAEYSESDLAQMSKAELVELINEKQKQYKNLVYSQIEALKLEMAAELADADSSLALLKKAVVDAKELLNDAQENLDNAKELGVNVDNLQNMLDTAKAAYENALDAFADAEKTLIEAKEALAESEKINLLANYKAEVANNEAALRAWINEAKEAGKITQEQFNYWSALITSNV